MNEVAEPSSATSHIQNTAPGPPNAMAVDTPAMLPTPTRPASEIISDWNEEMPCSELSPDFSWVIMSGMQRICRNRVTRVKYAPAPRHRYTSQFDQITLLSVSITPSTVPSF